MVKAYRTASRIEIRRGRARVLFPIEKGRLRPMEIDWGRPGRPLARSLYWLVFSDGETQRAIRSAARFELRREAAGRVRLEVRLALTRTLDVRLDFVFAEESEPLVAVEILATPGTARPGPLSFRCLGLVPGRPTREVRLCAAMYSGWTIEGKTVRIFPIAPEGVRRLALTIDPTDVKLGHGEFRAKGPVRCAPVSFGYPVAILGVPARNWEDVEIGGRFAIGLSDAPIGDPRHHVAARKLDPASNEIRPGRYSFRRYLDAYLRFLDHPEMFISLGDGCGLFHRGFYNCTGRGSYADKERKDGGGKQYAGALIFRHPAMRERERHPEAYPRMKLYGDYANMAEPLCDMVWGGAHNVQAALFLFRNRALEAKAEQIVRATLRFRNERGEGFQIAAGPSRGAWWNGYQPWRQAFSSRYYEPTLGMPDQGLFDYYLAELQRQGFVEDPALAAAVEANCRHYLLPKLGRDGLVHHVHDLAGRVGYTREKRRYPDPSPCASLLVALGFLSCYRLTGERRWKRWALRTARQVVDTYIRRCRWGYLEYDTMGADTMGIARMLLALSELYREEDAPWIKAAARLTLEHLYSHQHHHDLRLARYMNNEAAWGGTPSNYGSFVHGYTYNSPQGVTSLTLRSDLSEGLLACYQAFGDALARESLLKYLHDLTWHQVVRTDGEFGVGSTSEHVGLQAGYVQDTFQVSNAMPFGIEVFVKEKESI